MPGGGAHCAGYFPLLQTELGHEASFIVHERPGAEAGSPALSLAEQAVGLRDVIEAAGDGPALVVAHSLGGPVTVQLAADHPEVVAGVLLLDPTMFNGGRIIGILTPVTRMLALFERAPGINRWMWTRMRRTAARKIEGGPSPEVQAAIDVIVHPEQGRRTARRLRGFARDAHALTARLQADPIVVRGVIATAERPEKAPMRRAHRQMSELIGAELEVWEGTDHTMHLEQPARVVATIRRLLA